ncbi:MAG: hypothetical protein JST04_02425 [Bdellovibrionales bacterium]|nr:hypothetical protein [Bdellovibrionales bacterium]
MDQAKELVDKILSNQVTGFFFVLACAVGAVIGIAGSYWVAFQLAILVGAY